MHIQENAMTFIRTLTLTCVVALSVAQASAAPAAQPLRTLSFGIVPQQAAVKLAQTWIPVLEELAARSGYRIQFATARDIPTFEKRLAAGEYDLAYMNPYHYTVFHQVPGYRAIAKEANTRLVGVIVTRKDAPYQTLQDLSGQTLAFPAPASFAATVLPLATLAKAAIPIKPRYVGSHESVYLAVAQGFLPAGGGVMRTYEAMPAEIKEQLRILWTSNAFTPHAIAVHPRLKPEATARLTSALVSMSNDAAGRAVLAGIGFKGVEPALDQEWDDVRALHITQLESLLLE
jgi:phosphonate transport system substrate-binding protein